MMTMLWRVSLIAALLLCYMLLSCASEHEKGERQEFQKPDKRADSHIKVKRNHTTANDKRPKTLTPRKKVKKTGRVSVGPRSDIGCTRLGGICQPNRFICQGRYLKDKCLGSKTRQCCVQVGAWSVLCTGHHNNRVRACDAYGCGAFNSERANGLHKAVDVVCDDYGIISSPFSGSLAGPVSRQDPAGNQYDGVKLLSDGFARQRIVFIYIGVFCVKIFNIRPYRYLGPVAQGEALGYLLPLQDRFSGITSHLELQMCDGTDPSPFI